MTKPLIIITVLWALGIFSNVGLAKSKTEKVSGSEIAMLLERTERSVEFSPFGPASLSDEIRSNSSNFITTKEIMNFDVEFKALDESFYPLASRKTRFRLSGNVTRRSSQGLDILAEDTERVVIIARYLDDRRRLRTGLQYDNNQKLLATRLSYVEQINDIFSMYGVYKHTKDRQSAVAGVGLMFSDFSLTTEFGIADLDEIEEARHAGFEVRIPF